MKGPSKRVLFVVHALNLSGVSRHTMLLAQGLKSRGWEVGVIARDLAPGAPMGLEWFEAAGIRIFQAPFPGYGLKYKNASGAVRSIARLHRIAQEFRPALFHVHAPTLCPYAEIAARMNGIATVSTLHLQGIGGNKCRLARLGNRLFETAFGEFSIAVSAEMATVLNSLGMKADRIRIVLHGAEDDRFRPALAGERAAARKTYGLADGDRAVCMIAVLNENKNHELLIRALSELRGRGVDVIALCAGEGSPEQRGRIERLAREAGVADLVRLLGHQDSRQVMWASDASVLLSLQEAFGLVIVESMLCGLVPLRTPGAGASDQIIDGHNGFIIPFDDQRLLAQRLELLFSQPHLRLQMGAEAEKFARAHFTRQAMAQATERVYEDAIQRRLAAL